MLTRDRRLLHQKTITHGYWVRATDPGQQLSEVVNRFDLHRRMAPFHRCLDCNGPVSPVKKQAIMDQLEPLTRKYYTEFHQCRDCGKIYWRGSHYEHMLRRFSTLLGEDRAR